VLIKETEIYLNFSKGDRQFKDSVLSPSVSMKIRCSASSASEII
jgi:hypothetical protein